MGSIQSPETLRLSLIGDVEFIAHHFSEKELVFLLVDCSFEIDYFRVEELSTRTGNKILGFVLWLKTLKPELRSSFCQEPKNFKIPAYVKASASACT
ncbi:SAM-dependent methyltransferase [Methanosarcina horonobensis HB-1 = JCM 15518]|uniref:SAM-dependent methyltransferase n=1 Tax=Methanosarcina horonobensis HB-1 = JCM 15518 TaxID=1434110 RepID=A0A0E3SC28_9EURY|nr:hypothetical protein [Methanosarcina horonobensis]AKB79474.1 SAM-dependent methyltransferase [Methanosarcina horonobensis HB-1 = JCM 15518]